MDVEAVRCFVVSLVILSLVYFTECVPGIKMRKICRGSIDIMSMTGAYFEPYYKSHAKLTLLEYRDKNDRSEFPLSFGFKTRSPDGILFYGRTQNPKEFIALILKGGDLIYMIRCPSLSADIKLYIKNNARLNDGKWHKMAFMITYRTFNTMGRFEIDGVPQIMKQYILNCGELTTLTIGGYSEADKGDIADLVRLPGHFEGCIKKLFIIVAQSHQPKYYATSVCN